MSTKHDAVIRFGLSAGVSVRNTHVRPTEPEWREFVDLVSHAKVGSKDGTYFTRCTFSDERRLDGTAQAGALVVLDGDKGMDLETGELVDAAPAMASVHAALSAAGITHVIFPTHSNTPARPRYRVVVPYPVANKDVLRAAVDSLMAVLHAAGVGLACAKENYVFAQPWFLPRVPSAEALAQFVTLAHTGDGDIPMGHGTGEGDTTEHWAVEVLRGEELHAGALRAVGRMVRLNYSDEEITARFETIRPALMRARGARRISELLDRNELKRMIDGARKKDYDHSQKRAQAAALGEGVPPIVEVLSPDAMLDRLVFLADGSRVADRLAPKWAFALGDMKNMYAASRSEGLTPAGRPTRVDNIDIWRRDPARLTAHGLTFHPGANEFCDDPNGRPCLNTFLPYAREVGDPAHAGVVVVLDHIRFLYADRTDEFLDHLAHIEQFPGVLPHRGWLHVAMYQGMGRNLMAQLLARVWHGCTALGVDLAAVMDTGFNGVLASKLVAVVDELREGSRMEVWKHGETLKRVITETHRLINPKYGRHSVEFNCCRWLMFSNHMDALPLDTSDRRIDVVVNHNPPREEAYYVELARIIEDPEVINGFATFLAQRDISRFNAGAHARLTADKLTVIEQAMPEASKGLSAYLSDPEHKDCELFIAGELSTECGLNPVGSQAAMFRVAVEAVGLRRLGRLRMSTGDREVVYCRREHFKKWQGWEGCLPENYCPRRRIAQRVAQNKTGTGGW